MLGLPGVRSGARAVNVEYLQFVEFPHVWRVVFFHELRSFHVVRGAGEEPLPRRH